MKPRKTLCGIVLATGIFALSGCGKESGEYVSNVKIGEEHINISGQDPLSQIFSGVRILTVTKSGEKVIKYVASEGDTYKGLKLDRIEIRYGLSEMTLTVHDRIYDRTTMVGTKVLEEAQKKFDSYLKILKEKKEGLIKAREEAELKEGLEKIR